MDPSLLHTIELDEQFLDFSPYKIKELVHGATSRTESSPLLPNLKFDHQPIQPKFSWEG